MSFVSYLHLQFGDSSLKTQQLLLKSCFLTLQCCDLLLDSAVLSLLEIEMSLHLFLNTNQLVGKTLLDISCFHSEHGLKSVFFWSEDLHFFLVIVKFGGDIFYLLLKMEQNLLKGFGAFLWERLDWSQSSGLFNWSCFECFALFI